MTDDETRSGVFRNDRLRVAANTVLFKRQPRTAAPIPNHPVNQSVRAALKMYARVGRADKESIPIDHCHLPPERIVSPMHGDLAVADVECLRIGRFRRVVATDVLPHGTFAEGKCGHDGRLGSGASEQNGFKITSNPVRKSGLDIAQNDSVDVLLRINRDMRNKTFEPARLLDELARRVFAFAPAVGIFELADFKWRVRIDGP